MKALHFDAVASHPAMARPLMDQTRQLLGPFLRYLRQAIETAQQRQVRCQLGWRPARRVTAVELTARDTRLRIPRRRGGLCLLDWPADRAFDLSRPLNVVSRDTTVAVTRAARVDGGLRVETAEALAPEDVLFWCGHRCVAAPEPEVAPRALSTADGRGLRVLRCDLDAAGTHWHCVVEGLCDPGEFVVDGAPVHVEKLDALEGVARMIDAAGRSWVVSDGRLRVEELPADGILQADNGLRFDWRSKEARRARGHWVELLPPDDGDGDGEALTVDPRAVFLDGEVREVWTQPRHSEATTIKVKDVRRDDYQLCLERLPGPHERLHLPLDLRNLRLQRRALEQLASGPLPHHAPLLRLCEDPARTRWPTFEARVPAQWYSLTDPNRSGTEEQRRFVAKALGSPDFAFLEGPPGSGKTTAICELIQQLVAEGQRVLLCASTHVAIDNVLERLRAPGAAGPAIEALRVGRFDRVDERVQSCQIDEKIAALLARWREEGAFADLGDREREGIAERTVVMGADLTCGTTMGIASHPLFRERERQLPIATMPHWDVLIVDEASKTLTQDFIVPALLARRYVIVGDVRQLPPFNDRAEIVANLSSLVDDQQRPLFPEEHQRAVLLLTRLARLRLRETKLRWLVVESAAVLDRMEDELAQGSDPPFSLVRVVPRRGRVSRHVATVTVDEVRAGAVASLRLAASDIVLVALDLLPQVSALLPSDLLAARDLASPVVRLPESDPWLLRHAHAVAAKHRLASPLRERGTTVTAVAQVEEAEQKWLADKTLAEEIGWRIARIHELRRSTNHRERTRLEKALEGLLPTAVDIGAAVAEIQDIGLPSVLEVLQEGIGAERSTRRGALTEGIPKAHGAAFAARFERLSYQHRMHPEIAAFPREIFYGEGKALRDANTIALRDRAVGWSWTPFRQRRVWLDVDGREAHGVNDAEVRVMRGVLEDFIRWAKANEPPQGRAPRVWEVACLSFYTRQENAIAEMLRGLAGDGRQRFRCGAVEIVCGTVDRFQGREADLVILSMRNTGRTGFLDSPNRLNVAVTRAREQLVVVGSERYFAECRVHELEELARKTPRESGMKWQGGAR